MDDEKKFLDVFKALGKYASTVGEAFLSNFVASEIQNQIKQYEDKAVEVTKAFGLGRDRIVELKASMADAVVSVTQMGGGLQDVANIAKDVGTELGRNIILTSDSYEKLYATAQVTGKSYKELTKGFVDAGFSVYQISTNMEKVVNTARASGVNAQTVSGEVLRNMGLMDKYNFAGGVEGLAKMATQATNLRITIGDIQRTMEKAFEPDSAIEMAAALQRLGVAQGELLDPLRLMDLAQNDPAELQNQIAEMSKTFVEFNEQSKSFQIAPGAKRQLQEVAQALGMQPEAFARMAKAAAEMDDKLQKISFPDSFSEEQKKFVANMAQMGEGGEYMLRVDNKDLKLDEAMKLFQEQPKLYEKFVSDSKPKSIEDLAKEQLTTAKRVSANVESIANRMGAAVASSETQEQANQASIELSQAIPKLLSGEKLQVQGFRESGDKITQDLIKSIQKGDITGGLEKAGAESKKYLDSAFDELLGGAGKAFKDLGDSSNPLISIMSNLATKASDLFLKHENLDKSFFKLNESVDKTTSTFQGTVTPSKSTNKDITKELEAKPKQDVTTNEFKFTEPLKVEISVKGLEGLSQEQIAKIIEEGKLNQIILKAVEDAMKQKTSQ